ncbi:EamA family transporter [Rhodococcus opacus]|uniref:EamA family transporter n=1 Tax=Rhodococcus opacus TaxID=37919 RepID=UPI0002A2C8E1|nr:EamA family transporter [Rhodococcus opacus]ELB93674.1 amino acid ABC transporter [Rhodococcus wratislaviensis IFP 2016]MDX5968715.1 EamA family transporter [Rhodococcus opacus]NKY70815.1 EamA family transporter [Rhodococcus opacus]
MTSRDRLLGLTVVVLWGLNFLAIRAGLDHFPPFFFAALRFFVIAIPVILFIPRPQVPPKWLLVYGLGFGVGQFAFLFWAMHVGMPTGLASLVLQSSAPFTVVLGAVLLRERLRPTQVCGLLVAMAGMTVIGWDRAQHAALLPVALTLLAGLSWALGNIGNRKAASDQPMRLMLWMCVIPPLPMLALSFGVEGPSAGWDSLTSSLDGNGPLALAGLAYIVILGTVAGSGLWTALLSRYPAGMVAPFSLLVPIVGIGASWLVLHEEPSILSLIGGAVVIAGAAATQVSGRVRPSTLSRSRAPARVGV